MSLQGDEQDLKRCGRRTAVGRHARPLGETTASLEPARAHADP